MTIESSNSGYWLLPSDPNSGLLWFHCMTFLEPTIVLRS